MPKTGCGTIATFAAPGQLRLGVKAAASRVAPAIFAFKGHTMDRGILYILIALAAFWLSVACLVLLVT
jgi:hypothetical protein